MSSPCAPSSIDAIRPFASFVVLEAMVPGAATEELASMVISVVLGAISDAGGTCADMQSIAVTATGLDEIQAACFLEERRVPWVRDDPNLRDRLNHLIVIGRRGAFVAVYLDDSEHKAAVHAALLAGVFHGWHSVAESRLIAAFIHGRTLKTLWLGGTHRSVAVQPDSKVLSGRDLRHAIDPFGDSTFVAGAVRSSTAGVSLKRSGVWLSPSRDWSGFVLGMTTVLEALVAATAATSSQVHPGLATTQANFNGVHDAYHVEWADALTLSTEGRATTVLHLADDFEFGEPVPTAGGADFQIDVTQRDGSSATLTVFPRSDTRSVYFEVTGATGTFDRLRDAIEADAELIRVYYETGHTISQAAVTLAAVQDRQFDMTFANFHPAGFRYDVRREKPQIGSTLNLANITSDTDVSLFKWLYKEGLSQMGLNQPAAGLCWLYCDDRPGEVADFVHLDLSGAKPRICAFHLKGANNRRASRRVCPGPYELVVAQAMKNLRRIASGTLTSEIRTHITSHGQDRIWDIPWRAGAVASATPAAFLGGLATVTADCDYRVYVVQPHVLEASYTRPAGSTGAKQLHALLFGAQAMARAAQAEFIVVGAR